MTTALAAATITADHWHDGPPPFWPIFPILWFLFFVGAVATVVYLRRRSCGFAPQRSGEARLAELFATGEISEEDYRSRRSVLREK